MHLTHEIYSLQADVTENRNDIKKSSDDISSLNSIYNYGVFDYSYNLLNAGRIPFN